LEDKGYLSSDISWICLGITKLN